MRQWIAWLLAALVTLAILGGAVLLGWLWLVIVGGWGWPGGGGQP